ncbi:MULTISPECIES: beta-galactosidase [Streptomyces]|uniref:Beta-galactosidase n=1 Tax=Streptomyces solicathayae TaxID=3081768 RepID=A0ABZ0LN97_9ACTN|nr:beta-galactosidase [Streptomyces sp. HUAS YS2]WOX20934.1 beta-galactosidase [Streptomyces sp. HUAS YS2]
MGLTRRLLLLGVLGVLLASLGVVRILGHDGGDADAVYFGTLQTDPARASTEYAAGVRVAHLQLDWERFEPADGVFDAAYAAEVRATVRELRAAGLKVEAGLGLHHPPQWLAAAHPAAVWVDQRGARYAGTPNLVFSQEARDEVAVYLREVDRTVGLENFWALRVGVNEAGEFSYPPSGTAGATSYWAYDANAQAGAVAPGRPATVPANPFPGWRPGERTYAGRPFTEEQVARWYDWYLGALTDAVNWQLDQYTALGYTGRLKVLVPGSGYYPADRDAALAGYLAGPESGELLGRGAGFFTTLGGVRKLDNVRPVSTALVDGTGTSPDSGCRPEDDRVNIHASKNSAIRDWSSVRWISAIAKRAGFDRIDGESAGPHVSPYRPGVMEDAARQLTSCGLGGLMWAFDAQLYDGTPGSSLDDYAAVIDRHT